MPTPSKTTNTAAKSEKPKATGRFISATEGWKIAQVAKSWKGTPYAPLEKDKKLVSGSEKYKGGGAVKKEGADCSGATWKIYAEAGFPYGRYFNTVAFVDLVASDPHFIVAWLKDLAGSDADFVKGKHFFKKVSLPQVGDIGWWHNGKSGDAAAGHMAIYDQNSGMCGQRKNVEGNLWSAYNRKSGVNFGPAHTQFFDNDKESGYGIVVWYRYWIAP